MRLTVRINGITVEQDVDENDWVEVLIDGQQVVAIDCFYLAVDERDPSPGAPEGPHVNVGQHPDGESWEVLASVPVSSPVAADLRAMSDDLATKENA